MKKMFNQLMNVLNEMFITPFSEQPLVSISTGVVVCEDACESMLKAQELGQAAMNYFIANRLSDGATLTFLTQLKR